MTQSSWWKNTDGIQDAVNAQRQYFYSILKWDPNIWMSFNVGSFVDVRCSGQWREGQIAIHKAKSDPFPDRLYGLSDEHRKRIGEGNLGKLEAIFVHFIGKSGKFDRWIFFDRERALCS